MSKDGDSKEKLNKFPPALEPEVQEALNAANSRVLALKKKLESAGTGHKSSE